MIYHVGATLLTEMNDTLRVSGTSWWQPIALSDVLSADAVEAAGIFEDPAVTRTLIPLLAVGQQNEGELREIVSVYWVVTDLWFD